MYSVTVFTPSATTPVTVDEVKQFIKLDVNTDDTLIEALIIAATDIVEKYTGRALITKTLLLLGDELEDDLFLPYPPIQSIESFQVTDSTGAVHDVSSDSYLLDGELGRIRRAPGESYPNCRAYMGVEIKYKAGYGDNPADVPQAIREAIKRIVAKWYEDRTIGEIPLESEALLVPYIQNWV